MQQKDELMGLSVSIFKQKGFSTGKQVTIERWEGLEEQPRARDGSWGTRRDWPQRLAPCARPRAGREAAAAPLAQSQGPHALLHSAPPAPSPCSAFQSQVNTSDLNLNPAGNESEKRALAFAIQEGTVSKSYMLQTPSASSTRQVERGVCTLCESLCEESRLRCHLEATGECVPPRVQGQHLVAGRRESGVGRRVERGAGVLRRGSFLSH